LVTELRLANGTLIDATQPIDLPQQLVVVFDERMMTTGPDSVTNVDNWVLRRNGVEVSGVIAEIRFGLNKASEMGLFGAEVTNKWEAVVTLDGDPNTAGNQPLPAGNYTLTALTPVPDVPDTIPIEGNSGLRDAVGNPLGHSGYALNGADISQSFVVGLGASPTSVTGALPFANAMTYGETPSAVAVDADGDHVIALTAANQGTGIDKVYLQMADANGNAVLDPDFRTLFPVTPVSEFDFFENDAQRFASVAIDADGDFLVTWTNFHDGDGNGIFEDQDIYARRYNAVGQAMGAPFRVNTFTSGTQKWSSAAVDADGDFVITWSSYNQEGTGGGQLGLGFGVYARRYDSTGEPLGPEMLVNTTTAGNQQYASVAMDADGDFVVTWTSSQNGLNNDIYMRAFDAAAGVFGPETLVNTTAAGDQVYSDVAINLAGQSAVVTWSSSGAQDGSGFGVYATTFGIGALGAVGATSGELLVNTTTLGDQRFSSVSMDHQGAFTVAWSGFGNQLYQSDPSQSGVFFQRFGQTGNQIGGEVRANFGTEGNQFAPSIGSDGEGNFIIAFTAQDAVGGPLNVYRSLGTDYVSMPDNDGPLVTDVTLADKTHVAQGDTISSSHSVSQLVVFFSENLSTRDGAMGPDSVLNPSNWKLELDGNEILGAVKDVTFSWDGNARKYRAVVQFDGNGLVSGTPALEPGNYVLTIRDAISDVYTPDVDENYFGGNAVDGNFDGIPGTGAGMDGYRLNFRVAASGTDTGVGGGTQLANGRTNPETPGAVAVDADGDYVVTWTTYDTTLGHDRVYLQMFDAAGEPIPSMPHPFAVTPIGAHPTFNHDDQRFAAVACDADGEF
ncbi:MAG TPA: hypothetical protein VE890_12535, partial [Thermoguttaceae bacterium]|nr:hypothetical protein [Thermoguttaceae bacterium]